MELSKDQKKKKLIDLLNDFPADGTRGRLAFRNLIVSGLVMFGNVTAEEYEQRMGRLIDNEQK